MHTVAFSYCAWHTHCTQVGKDRSITVRRRKDAVSCNPCPSAKKKKKSSELNSCKSTVHCHLLCSADKMKPQKHWELKFIATHRENTRKLCSMVEKKNHVMQHTEPGNFSSLFNYVLETLAQGVEREWELFCAYLLSAFLL